MISGEKFFSSHLRMAEFLIVMAVTNPDVSPYKGMSMFLVPADTPGINVLHHLGMGSEDWYEGTHAHVRYEEVRVPAENLLGGEGQAFEVAQRRLGGGRIHHAMRSVARAKKMFEMTCERALSRHTQGSVLADKQAVQLSIADSWMKLEQFRLLVMYTAWLIDQSSTAQVRHYISACKVVAAEVLADIAAKAAHIHGALGVSNTMSLYDGGGTMSLVDGPSEVHKIAVARQVLKDYRPHSDGWPTGLDPRRLVNARRRFEEIVQQHFPDPETQSAFGSFLQQSTVPDDLYKECRTTSTISSEPTSEMPALPMDEVELTRRMRGRARTEGREGVCNHRWKLEPDLLTRTLATGREIVVKSGVPGLEPVRNRDMLRQAKVHKALESSNVPVPRVLAEDPGEPPEIAPFFVMERCLASASRSHCLRSVPTLPTTSTDASSRRAGTWQSFIGQI